MGKLLYRLGGEACCVRVDDHGVVLFFSCFGKPPSRYELRTQRKLTRYSIPNRRAITRWSTPKQLFAFPATCVSALHHRGGLLFHNTIAFGVHKPAETTVVLFLYFADNLTATAGNLLQCRLQIVDDQIKHKGLPGRLEVIRPPLEGRPDRAPAGWHCRRLHRLHWPYPFSQRAFRSACLTGERPRRGYGRARVVAKTRVLTRGLPTGAAVD